MRGATVVTRTVTEGAAEFQSTRPLRGATAKPELADAAHFAFQSTRPARGATVSDATVYHVRLFQSTRPARGATPLTFQLHDCYGISIHAPREGRDKEDVKAITGKAGFQSTRPARGATRRT